MYKRYAKKIKFIIKTHKQLRKNWLFVFISYQFGTSALCSFCYRILLKARQGKILHCVTQHRVRLCSVLDNFRFWENFNQWLLIMLAMLVSSECCYTLCLSAWSPTTRCGRQHGVRLRAVVVSVEFDYSLW